MNTEASQDKTVSMTTGQRLRQAREQLGLSQQTVAERLCLKMSTVRDIEEDSVSADLASTFVRGYIRSYAKLVHLPEDELLPMLAKQAPLKMAKVAPMQSFSLGKRRKKRDGWLMIFTWLVVFVVIGLTGAWWWQNHKAAQDDLVPMTDQNGSSGDSGQSIPLGETSGDSTAPAAPDESNTAASDNSATSTPATSAPAASTTTTPATTQTDSSNAVVSPSQAPQDTTSAAPATTNPATSTTPQMPVGAAAVSEPAADPNAVVMNFTADCWLEVSDATGKKLFSGIQRSGGKLSLAGTPPYRLKIGAPSAVQVQYQNQPVDLSRFIRNNQVARLTLGAQ